MPHKDPEARRAYERAYRKAHREKMNESSRKWVAAHPEQRRAGANASAIKNGKKRRLKQRYGLTPEAYHQMWERQRGLCLGCQQPLQGKADVDHDHITGAVRGLLCHSCNTALGFVKDQSSTLYRLASYLHYDRTKMMVYIVGSLRNPAVLKVGDALRAQGYDAFDNWMSAGPTADDSWKEYEAHLGHSYAEALNGRSARHVFNFDRAHLDLSDAAILVMPAGKSGHLELGYMSGRGKPTYILTESEPERFDVMSQFAPMVTHDLWAVILDLEEKRAALGLTK